MRLLRDGQKIRETYEVERFLGAGAFAEVYRVRHRFLGRQAMKVFKQGMSAAETEELLVEAIVLSRLGHPNVVRVFDANTTETTAGESGFFTMEYVAGGTLEQFWRSHGARFVPATASLEIAAQVCRGLAVAHSESPAVIHRDVKPQNILVGYAETGLRAKLSDFGLAKSANPLTAALSARGTLAFKPPEVFAHGRDSAAADVWALGSVLYLLLTDLLPFTRRGDRGEPLETRFDEPLVAPSRLNIQVHPKVDEVVLRALSLNVGARHRDAVELLSDLERVVALPEVRTREERSPGHKEAMGAAAPAPEGRARALAKEALSLATRPGKLGEAADLMEEALAAAPELREAYAYRLQLWRRGLVS